MRDFTPWHLKEKPMTQEFMEIARSADSQAECDAWEKRNEKQEEAHDLFGNAIVSSFLLCPCSSTDSEVFE